MLMQAQSQHSTGTPTDIQDLVLDRYTYLMVDIHRGEGENLNALCQLINTSCDMPMLAIFRDISLQTNSPGTYASALIQFLRERSSKPQLR